MTIDNNIIIVDKISYSHSDIPTNVKNFNLKIMTQNHMEYNVKYALSLNPQTKFPKKIVRITMSKRFINIEEFSFSYDKNMVDVIGNTQSFLIENIISISTETYEKVNNTCDLCNHEIADNIIPESTHIQDIENNDGEILT